MPEHTKNLISKNLYKLSLDELGTLIDKPEAFPSRTNVHFVDVKSPDIVDMITWERGAGFTMAGGTGATSVVISGYRLGVLDKNVQVHLPGGELQITVYEKDDKLGAFMEGDAVSVFEGIMELEF